MATFHENLVQSFHNFRDKYLKANGNFFKFSYDQTKQKYGYVIDNKFNEFGKTDSGNNYLECSTARSTAAKVVTATDFTLDVGTIIAVRFTDTGTSNPSSGNLTLNVGNTGAKTIVDGHTNKTVVTYSSGAWFYNNLVNEFVYDGTYWVWLNKDNDTTYSGGTLYTSASKTGSGTIVTNTIVSGTSMNNAIGTLLNNDAALNASLADKVSKQNLKAIYYGPPMPAADSQNNKIVRVPFPNGIKPDQLGLVMAQSPGHQSYTISSYSIENRYIQVELSTIPDSTEALYVICECLYN